MLLENNTERVMNLVDIIDDLNGINKVRLAIHILEENCFSTISVCKGWRIQIQNMIVWNWSHSIFRFMNWII